MRRFEYCSLLNAIDMDTTKKPEKQISQRKPRRAPRRRSCLPVVIRYLGMETIGRVYDISTAGVAIDLLGPFYALEGNLVRVECTEWCFLEARVRWMGKGRVGLEFEPSTNAVAKVKAYFKFFHKDPLMMSA